MEYTPFSPFKRSISHAHLRLVDPPAPDTRAKPVSKWDLLRELSKAQAAFGVTERDLTALQGLLSFFPDTNLGEREDMVVFPSNKALCERLNGMACSTLRRHLGRLVEAGLIARRDSPNGKRYMRRDGDAQVAFGFDLTPLYARAVEIATAAQAVRDAERRLHRLREVVSLMRRDLASVAEYGADLRPDLALWVECGMQAMAIARALRRKLGLEELHQFQSLLETLLNQARNVLDGHETEEMSVNDAKNEHHYLNSNKDTSDFELGFGKAQGQADSPDPDMAEGEASNSVTTPKLPLHLVIASCPTLKTFYTGEVRHWHQLFDAACHVRPAMGISPQAWEDAQRCMGPEQAAIVVVAMLERFAEIKSPGGYLRALTAKAAAGTFSAGPMVMALLAKRHAA